MKLPEDKTERNKILILILIGVAAVGYGGHMFLIAPFLQDRKDTEAHITELEDKLWRARKDIDITHHNLERNREAVNHILEVSETKRQILRPNLGNYLLVAADIVGRHADALNLEIESINETAAPSTTAPVDEADPNAPRLKAYAVNVSLTCGLHDTLKLLRAIETENPYLCITRLGVIGRPQSPTEHAVSFDIQWPIWADPTYPVRLAAERLADEEKQ
jgi:hypothetical protein